MDYSNTNRESSPPAQHAAVEVAGPALAEVDPRFMGRGNIPSWQDLESKDNDPVTAEHYVGEPYASPTTLPIPFANRGNGDMVAYPGPDEQKPSVGMEQGGGVNDTPELADHTQGSDESGKSDPQQEQPALYKDGRNRPIGRHRGGSRVRPPSATGAADLRRGAEARSLSPDARAVVGAQAVGTYLGGVI